MRKWAHKVNQVLSGLAGWLMFAMLMLLIADVVSRSYGRPLLLMAELSVFVMMIVIYLGFARCEELNEHVRLEFVVNALPMAIRPKMFAAVNLLAVVSIALLFYAVTRDAWSSFVTGSAIEGTVDIPIWPTKFVMVVGMVFFLLQGIVNLLDPAVESEEVGHVPDDE